MYCAALSAGASNWNKCHFWVLLHGSAKTLPDCASDYRTSTVYGDSLVWGSWVFPSRADFRWVCSLFPHRSLFQRHQLFRAAGLFPLSTRRACLGLRSAIAWWGRDDFGVAGIMVGFPGECTAHPWRALRMCCADLWRGRRFVWLHVTPIRGDG